MKKILRITLITLVFFAMTGIADRKAQAQPLASITYNFTGYSIPAGKNPLFTLNQTGVSTLLKRNADGTYAINSAGNFSADKAAVNNFITSLAAMYDIPGVTALNKQAEVNYLITAINSGISDPSHTPSVSVTPTSALMTSAAVTQPLASTASAAGGSTYVDVNLTNQQLIYVVNGSPALISDIVTGNTSRGRSTPVGTYSIYAKATNRTLKGQGYSAFVKYWMPFYGGYGLHDANWRGSFGGSIYKTNGSHGCVNMPSAMAEALFNTVNVGTPVIVHY